jgi:hypothetical protein
MQIAIQKPIDYPEKIRFKNVRHALDEILA